ncbi:MAG: hypothetical protein K0M40_17615 [Prolixibacteraceae bacterium]|nr:hypothetical protein [Prolixibacteraceae bacterium]
MREIIIFFCGIVFYFLLDLLKSYYKKKLENQANIEDLHYITKIAEVVKQDFRKELASIDAQLNVLSKQSSLIDEKSLQVLNIFFERCQEIRDLYSMNFGEFIGNDLEKALAEYQISVDAVHRKLWSDYHNFLLFHIKNDEFLNSANNIVSRSSRMKSTFNKHYGKIKLAILEERGYYKDVTYVEAVEKSDKVFKDYYKDLKSDHDIFNSKFQDLRKSMSEYFSEYGLRYKNE